MLNSDKDLIAYAEPIEGGLRIVFVDGLTAIFTSGYLRAAAEFEKEGFRGDAFRKSAPARTGRFH